MRKDGLTTQSIFFNDIVNIQVMNIYIYIFILYQYGQTGKNRILTNRQQQDLQQGQGHPNTKKVVYHQSPRAGQK
jgi:hypothetical protein